MLPTIRHGDHSDTVKVAQLLLSYEPADGEYTADFVAFVCAWQRDHGLDPDGIIGPATWAAIAQAAPTVSTKAHRYGEYAQAAQLLAGIEDADGIYGPKTKAAIATRQAASGLKADGICGPKTWAMLITGAGIADNSTTDAGNYSNTSNSSAAVQPPDFKQYDKRWASKMYSNHGDKSQTMKSSACGPTSMADIIAAWWDKDILPPEVADKALAWGCRTANSGTTSALFSKCASLYKATKYLPTKSIDNAIACLNAGGLVIVNFGPGTKGKSSYQKWTKGGHYCVIWKWDGEVFHINDPASSSAKRAKGTRAEVLDARKGFYCFWR